MTDALGQMHGERAFHAPAVVILTSAREVKGVKRIMISGVVLADADQPQVWQRRTGTMIFIPQKIEEPIKKANERLDQMVTAHLDADYGLDEGEDEHRYWKTVWEPTK